MTAPAKPRLHDRTRARRAKPSSSTSFFTHVCGDPPSDDQRQAFATVVDQLERRRREAGS